MKKVLFLSLTAILLYPILSQGQPTLSRLIAATNYVFSSPTLTVPSDSVAYFYTGDNGGDLTHTIRFTTDTTWKDTGSFYYPFAAGKQLFDSANNISTTTYQYYSSGAWADSILRSYTYDTNGNITQTLVQLWKNATAAWVNSKLTDYTYDAANNLLTFVYSTWDTATSVWVAGKQYINTYNSAEQMLATQVKIWDVPSGSFLNYSYDTFTYDGSGNQVTDLKQTWTGSAWMNSTYDVRTFDGTGAVLTDTTFSGSATSGGWHYYMLAADSNDASGNQLKSVLSTWITSQNRFLTTTRYDYTYNSFNQLTSSKSQHRSNTGWQFTPLDALSLYYYETYVSHVRTPALSAGQLKLNVFPNPASEYVGLRFDQAEAGAAEVTVYNMRGAIVSRRQLPAAEHCNKTIPVNNWAPGNYLVTVSTQAGSVTRQFVVVH